VSSGGLHLRSSRPLDAGTRVFGVVTLPTGAAIAADGRVVRLTVGDDSLWGIAVQFDKAELIRSRDASA
jgi:hypothetical protein